MEGGTVGISEAPANPSIIPPAGEKVYLGYDVKNGKVSTVYSCFKRNDKEYCLKGYDTGAYTTNVEIIKDAYKKVVDTDACSSDEDYYYCYADELGADTSLSGTVSVWYGSLCCYVYDDDDSGDINCH